MKTNHVTVSKNLVTGYDINIIGQSAPDPGFYVIDDNNPLIIGLVNSKEGVSQDPTETLISDENNSRAYIKLESHLEYDFNVSMNEIGWKISQKSSPLSYDPVLAPLLPDEINNLVTRLLLAPFEVLIKVLKSIIEAAMLIGKLVTSEAGPTGNTNITVGSGG